jgi:hypothetical protein
MERYIIVEGELQSGKMFMQSLYNTRQLQNYLHSCGWVLLILPTITIVLFVI